MDVERSGGAALRRRERRLRAWQWHVRTAVQLALADKLHHSLAGEGVDGAGRSPTGIDGERHGAGGGELPALPAPRVGHTAARGQRNSRLSSSALPPEPRPRREGKGGGGAEEERGGAEGEEGEGGALGVACALVTDSSLCTSGVLCVHRLVLDLYDCVWLKFATPLR